MRATQGEGPAAERLSAAIRVATLKLAIGGVVSSATLALGAEWSDSGQANMVPSPLRVTWHEAEVCRVSFNPAA